MTAAQRVGARGGELRKEPSREGRVSKAGRDRLHGRRERSRSGQERKGEKPACPLREYPEGGHSGGRGGRQSPEHRRRRRPGGGGGGGQELTTW